MYYCYQDDEQLYLFSNSFSVKKEYLYGEEIVSRHCEHKVVNDIIVLSIQFDKMTIVQSVNKKITRLLDQIGLIGNIEMTCISGTSF